MLNLSVLNSTKQKLILSPVLSILDPIKHNPQSFLFQIELENNQYLASPFSSDQFAIDIESDNKSNNVVIMIEGLFLNIRHRSSYKRLIEKTIHKTCILFIHSVRHISSKD